MNASKNESSKRPGSIDLIKLFEAEANDLMAAVERGRLLHETKNYRESGSPLEATFRAFWKSRQHL